MAAKDGGKDEEATEADETEGEAARAGIDRLTAGDELESALILRADNRMRSFSFSPVMSRDGKSCRILVALHNNSLEVWGLDGVTGGTSLVLEGGDGPRSRGAKDAKNDDEEGVTCSRLAILDMQGHRSDVRAVAVSSDVSMVASVSHGLAKVWSSRSRQCVRSCACGFGLTVAFAPGNRHLLVGTKEGNLQVRRLLAGGKPRRYV